jgi:hypothetical protein
VTFTLRLFEYGGTGDTVSEHLWPDRFRDASRGLSDRWHAVGERVARPIQSTLEHAGTGLHAAQYRLAGELDGLRVRLGAHLDRSRKVLVWGAVLALLTAIEVAIAFPLLIGPSRQAVESVDRAAEAIVSKATGDDGSSQAGAAADRGRDVLGKGPADSRGPGNRPGAALVVVGGEEALSGEDNAEAADQTGEATSVATTSTSESERQERSTPARRNPPAGDGLATDPPAKSVATPQSPPPPPPPSLQSAPPPPPTTSTTATTRVVVLPGVPVTKKPRNRNDDDEDEDERRNTTTTTTTTSSGSPQPPPPPPPPTTTTTTSDEEEDERERGRGSGNDEDEEDEEDDDDDEDDDD